MKNKFKKYVSSVVVFMGVLTSLLQGDFSSNGIDLSEQNELVESKETSVEVLTQRKYFFVMEENEEKEIDFSSPNVEFKEGNERFYRNEYVAKEGTKVHGVKGVVMELNNSCGEGKADGLYGGCHSSQEGLGNYVTIVTEDGYRVTYGHLKDVHLNSKEGVIGTVGSTGNTSSPKLTVLVKDKEGKPVNPSVVFNKQ